MKFKTNRDLYFYYSIHCDQYFLYSVLYNEKDYNISGLIKKGTRGHLLKNTIGTVEQVTLHGQIGTFIVRKTFLDLLPE